MMALLLIGILLAIAAGVVYVIQNPEVLGKLQNAIREGSKAVNEEPVPATSKRVGYRAGPLKFTQRMGTLPSDSFITILDPKSAKLIKMQVVTAEILHGREQLKGSKEWVRSGDEWEAVLCTCPSWPDVLLVKLDKESYLFNKHISFGPEDAKQFEPYAQEFGHKKGQVAGSVKMEFDGDQYKIQDIGVWDVTASNGEPHISVMARWIVAHGENDVAIIVEDGKGNNDGVWIGYQVDLNRIVTDVLSSDER